MPDGLFRQFARVARGLGRGLGKGLAGIPSSRPPALPGLTQDKSGLQEQPGASERRSFQERPTLRRAGIRQVDSGPSWLESRAAQGIEGTLAERIVYKELRRQGIEFEYGPSFSSGDSPQPSLGGVPVNFIIWDRNPPIGLDVLSDWQPSPSGPPYRDEYKAIRLESQGYPYAVLWDQTDIYPSAERLEQELDRILGLSFMQIGMASPAGALPGIRAAYPTDSPDLIGSTPSDFDALLLNGLDGADMMRVTELEEKVRQLEHLISTHGDRHSPTGLDTPRLVPLGEALARPARNVSNRLQRRGAPVQFLFSTTDENAFFSPADGVGIVGVLLEDTPDDAIGTVAISGYVDYVNADSAVTANNFLQSAGIIGGDDYAIGTDIPTSMTFGQALTDYDAATGTVRAIIGHTPWDNVVNTGNQTSTRQNSTSPLTIASASSVDLNIPSGFAKMLRFTIQGDYLNNSGSDATLQLKVTLTDGSGNNTPIDITSAPIFSSSEVRAWRMTVEVGGKTGPESQLVSVQGMLSQPDNAPAAGAGDWGSAFPLNAVAVDTRDSDALDIAVTLTNSAADNNIRIRRYFFMAEYL